MKASRPSFLFPRRRLHCSVMKRPRKREGPRLPPRARPTGRDDIASSVFGQRLNEPDVETFLNRCCVARHAGIGEHAGRIALDYQQTIGQMNPSLVRDGPSSNKWTRRIHYGFDDDEALLRSGS